MARGPAARALSARAWILRNPRRVLPAAGVQVLVTALLVATLTPLNIFETTSETYIRSLQVFTTVTPRLRNDFDEELLARLDANPAQERRLPAKTFWIRVPMLVSEGGAPMLALARGEQEDFLRRVGLRLTAGTLPQRGSDGAALHEAVLRAREQGIGDVFGQIEDSEDATPGRFEVVGVLAGDARLGIVDLDYASIPDFVLARRDTFQVVYARSGRKAESDRYLREASDARGRPLFRVIDEDYVRRRMASVQKNLPVLVGFLTGVEAVVVALVTALINLLIFHTRLDEFALHLAVGHRRGRLVRKLTRESVLTSVAAWALGLALGLLATWLYQKHLLEPRAILMRPVDLRAILYTTMVPLLSASVSALALARRLRRMDPVAVIQRRGG